MDYKSLQELVLHVRRAFTPHFCESITDHNGPQVNPTTSGFPLNNNNHELQTTAPIQWRKKRKLKRNQVDLSSVKFHSHSEGKRKQYLSRII